VSRPAAANARTAILAAALSLATLAAPAAAGAPRPPDRAGCDRPQWVPAIGSACPVPGGFLVSVGDDAVFTHGGDPVPSDRRADVGGDGMRKPACIKSAATEFHVHVIYARAPDVPDNFAKRLYMIRREVERMNSFVHQEAKEFKRSLDLRVLCSGKDILVDRVTLQTPLEQTSFSSVTNELFEMGYNSVMAKYAVYFDGRFPGAPGGTGTLDMGDSSSGPGNANNIGPDWSVTWGIPEGGAAGVMLHELGHNLGAVVRDAPNSSGAGHCNDGSDVMCYDDHGPYSDGFKANVCSTTHFDCRHNDYFHPKPGKSNFLYDHWNIAGSQQRFLAGCTYKTGVFTAGAGGADPEGEAELVRKQFPQEQRPQQTSFVAKTYTVPKACRGRAFTASATVEPPSSLTGSDAGALAEQVGYPVVARQVRFDVDVCWLKGSTLLRCHAGGTFEHGKVPSGATKARVILNAGVSAIVVLNVV